jgi:eukaryotic-like serine/threonine-protein kinase
MSTNGKSKKSIGMRAKELGRSAVAGVRRRPWVSGFVALAMIMLVSAVLLRARIQRMIAGSAPSVAQLQKDATTGNSPAQWRALGHAEFAKGHAMAALKAYDRALSLDHAAVDEQMRTNLVAAYYGKAQPAAQDFVVRHKLVDVTPRLERLTDDGDYRVRWAAMSTLEKLGKTSKYDYRRALTADLDSSQCEVRRKAAERLGELGDQHAIPSLRLAKKKDHDATPWYKATCLGSRPDRAEKQILTKSTHKA